MADKRTALDAYQKFFGEICFMSVPFAFGTCLVQWLCSRDRMGSHGLHSDDCYFAVCTSLNVSFVLMFS